MGVSWAMTFDIAWTEEHLDSPPGSASENLNGLTTCPELVGYCDGFSWCIMSRLIFSAPTEELQGRWSLEA